MQLLLFSNIYRKFNWKFIRSFGTDHLKQILIFHMTGDRIQITINILGSRELVMYLWVGSKSHSQISFHGLSFIHISVNIFIYAESNNNLTLTLIISELHWLISFGVKGFKPILPPPLESGFCPHLEFQFLPPSKLVFCLV